MWRELQGIEMTDSSNGKDDSLSSIETLLEKKYGAILEQTTP